MLVLYKPSMWSENRLRIRKFSITYRAAVKYPFVHVLRLVVQIFHLSGRHKIAQYSHDERNKL